MTEVRDELNGWADKYLAATSWSAKREALIHYLDLLQMAAADRGYAWSATKSNSNPDALKEVLRMVYPEGEPPFFNLKPVMELQEALLQVDNREKPALFQSSKTGKPPLPRKKMYWWAVSAGLITVLMQRFKRSEQDAAKKVAAALTKYGKPLPGKASTNTAIWELLQTWRDKCMSGEKGSLAGYWYGIVVNLGYQAETTEDQLLSSIFGSSDMLGSYAPQPKTNGGRIH